MDLIKLYRYGNINTLFIYFCKLPWVCFCTFSTFNEPQKVTAIVLTSIVAI